MAVAAAKQAFSRGEALRLLKLSERQLTSWERQELVRGFASYGFKELLALRTLMELRRSRVSPTQVRRALTALAEKLRHIPDPLTQLRIYADGKRVRVDLDGRAMEAESFQLLLDFDRSEISRLLEFKAPAADSTLADRKRRVSAEHWFQRGLELEQTGAPANEVIDAYRKVLEFDPNSAGALVNLGTIHFNARNWREAERNYKAALEADPRYSLAHFDLANLYDERGDRGKAIHHYEEALRIAPNYGDAHYNLALLCQGSNQTMKAVRHWTAYLKLDPSSHWSTIARRELAKLRQEAVLPGLKG